MQHFSVARLWTIIIVSMFVFVSTIVTTFSIYANKGVTLFDTDFTTATRGRLFEPLPVQTGTIIPQTGIVSIIQVGETPPIPYPEPADGTSNPSQDQTSYPPPDEGVERALAVDGADGQTTALLNWNNYPSALPTDMTETVTVQITGEFFALSNDVGNASFGLLSNESFFEFFSFGPDGQLTRNSEPLGLNYRARTGDGDLPYPGPDDNASDEIIRLDVRLTLKNGNNQARITVTTDDGRREIKSSLDTAFTIATLNQLRFQATDGSGAAAVTRLNVYLMTKDSEFDDDPAADITINESDIVQEVVTINDQVFVNLTLTVVNTGGKARQSILTFALHDDDTTRADLADYFELADVRFLKGTGFVKSLADEQVQIGLGENNIIPSAGTNGIIQFQLVFKLKDTVLATDDTDTNTQLSVDVPFTLSFKDTSGSQEIAIPPVTIVIPYTVPQPLDDLTEGEMTRLAIEGIDMRLRSRWESLGGLDIFGLPLTEAETLSNGITVQYFERVRLEYHPDLEGTDFEVLIGLLGVELGYQTPPSSNFDHLDVTEAQWFYMETGHVIGAPFREYWAEQGGLAIFGLPISAMVTEDGRQVQYFERARMEAWPENQGTPYEVQLGFLGIVSLQSNGDN